MLSSKPRAVNCEETQHLVQKLTPRRIGAEQAEEEEKGRAAGDEKRRHTYFDHNLIVRRRVCGTNLHTGPDDREGNLIMHSSCSGDHAR